MNKKYAWTLAELMLALVFIMVIAGFLISNFKPGQQNSKIKVYAAIRNLEKGIISVQDYYTKKAANQAETNVSNGNVGAVKRTIFYKNPTIENAGNDTFCTVLADAFTLKQAADCRKNTSNPNFVFANGVAIYGLASDPFTFFSGDSNFERVAAYKNILIDVDGTKGRNRLGVDRFPLRIYSLDNIVLPVNCGETSFFDWRYEDQIGQSTPTLTDAKKNPYCKTGTSFNGSRSSQNFWLDSEMITYDTFYNKIVTQNNGNNVSQQNNLQAYSKNLAETICGVYGGTRYLSVSQCVSYGYKMLTNCPSIESCKKCGSACPMNQAGNAQTTQGDNGTCMQLYNTLNNKDNFCYYVLHRPSAGMSTIVSGIVGSELDME